MFWLIVGVMVFVGPVVLLIRAAPKCEDCGNSECEICLILGVLVIIVFLAAVLIPMWMGWETDTLEPQHRAGILCNRDRNTGWDVQWDDSGEMHGHRFGRSDGINWRPVKAGQPITVRSRIWKFDPWWGRVVSPLPSPRVVRR